MISNKVYFIIKFVPWHGRSVGKFSARSRYCTIIELFWNGLKWTKIGKKALKIALINYKIVKSCWDLTHTSTMPWGKFKDKKFFLRNQISSNRFWRFCFLLSKFWESLKIYLIKNRNLKIGWTKIDFSENLCFNLICPIAWLKCE